MSQSTQEQNVKPEESVSGRLGRKTRWIASAQCLVRYGALPAEWEQIHAAGTGDQRRAIHVVRLAPGGLRVAVKSFADADAASAEYSRQKATARRYRGTVAPICMSRIGRHIVLPYLSGGTLYDRLSDDAASDSISASAAWLGSLHAHPVEDLQRVSLASEYDELLSRPSIDARPTLLRVAEAWRSAASSSTDTTVPLHGDFHPKNIAFDTDGRLGILDFAPHTAGPAVLDLAQYLAHLQLHLMLGPLDAAALWPRWRNAVLNGYGRPELGHGIPLAAAIQLRRFHMLLFTFTRPEGQLRAKREAFLWREVMKPPTEPRAVLRL